MIKVLGDRVLVALPPREDEMVSAGGIVLVKDPDRFQTPTRGIVVAMGEKTGTVLIDDVLALFQDVLPVHGKVGHMGRVAHYRLCDALGLVGSLQPAPFDVQVGDCVIFPRSAGEEIHDGEIDYVIVREAEILGVLEPKETEAA